MCGCARMPNDVHLLGGALIFVVVGIGLWCASRRRDCSSTQQSCGSTPAFEPPDAGEADGSCSAAPVRLVRRGRLRATGHAKRLPLLADLAAGFKPTNDLIEARWVNPELLADLGH
jgi:hypothetical protein